MEMPYSLASSIYPTQGKQIDYYDKNSKYLVVITPPSDLAVSLFQYAQDFFCAAHTISEFMLNTIQPDIAKLDTYFFSITFLYRHSLELGLKAIGFQSILGEQERKDFINSSKHNLKDILEIIQAQGNPIRPIKELEWLHLYFEGISEMDRESDSFRYPFHIVRQSDEIESKNKYIIKRVFKAQTHIDLIKFINKFEAAYEIIVKWYMHSKDNASEWIGLSPKFIEEGGYYYAQSVVGYKNNRQGFFPYTKAYLETANYLKWYMKNEIDLGNTSSANQLFLPMCYLYRNCLELSLKAIWFEEIDEDFQKKCKVVSKKKHSIEGMWNKLKPYVIAYNQDPTDVSYIDTIENYCIQVHTLDGDASRFRYPMAKNLQAYHTSAKQYDFVHIGDFFEEINNIFDAIDYQFSCINEIKDEMEEY